MFTPRLTRPESGNKYYIRKPSGYSNAIKGYPTDLNCDVLSNCVGYAVGRFHEIAERPDMGLIDPVNAENLFQNAKEHGLKTGNMPKLGALIVWQKGATLGSADGAGHVAVVEQILTGGRITTSESGWGASKPFWIGHYDFPYNYKTGYRLLGFVYQPKDTSTIPSGVIKRGDKGSDVKWMQERLISAKYLRSSELDSDFGNVTFGALLAFQFDNGLAVDGVCGPKTIEMLKMK